MGMVILFFIVVAYMGIDWTKFGWSLLPNLPAKTDRSAEPADIIISLVTTTKVHLPSSASLSLAGSLSSLLVKLEWSSL